MRRYRPLWLTVLALTTVGVASCGEGKRPPNRTRPPIKFRPRPSLRSQATAGAPAPTCRVSRAPGGRLPPQLSLTRPGGRLDAIGGSKTNNIPNTPVGRVQVYNPATNTWTTKATLPHDVTGYGNNGAQVIGGLVYVPGGLFKWQRAPYLQVYNPRTNVWVDKAQMPAIPPYGFRGLGLRRERCDRREAVCAWHLRGSGAVCGEAFERYDPATDKWTILPLPPVVPMFDRAAGVLNKKFYVTDGKVLEVYDPATNKWSQRAPMPSGRSGFTSAAVNNKLYVVGGFYAGTVSGRVDVYDPVTNTWTNKAPIPRREAGLSAGRVVVNGQARLDVVGGLYWATTCSTCRSKMALALSLLGRG